MLDSLTIGDVLPPAAPPQPIQGAPSDPAWYCLITEPRAEPRAAAWLSGRGVETWEATEQARRAAPKSRAKVVYYDRRILPRYLFARFTGEPRWHAVRACPWLTGAVGVDGRPAVISEAAMEQMHGVPQRLAAIRKNAARAMQVRPGDRARITAGPLEGWVVDVSRIEGASAWFDAPLLGTREISVSLASLSKSTAN